MLTLNQVNLNLERVQNAVSALPFSIDTGSIGVIEAEVDFSNLNMKCVSLELKNVCFAMQAREPTTSSHPLNPLLENLNQSMSACKIQVDALEIDLKQVIAVCPALQPFTNLEGSVKAEKAQMQYNSSDEVEVEMNQFHLNSNVPCSQDEQINSGDPKTSKNALDIVAKWIDQMKYTVSLHNVSLIFQGPKDTQANLTIQTVRSVYDDPSTKKLEIEGLQLALSSENSEETPILWSSQETKGGVHINISKREQHVHFDVSLHTLNGKCKRSQCKELLDLVYAYSFDGADNAIAAGDAAHAIQTSLDEDEYYYNQKTQEYTKSRPDDINRNWAIIKTKITSKP